jgi:predicted permease
MKIPADLRHAARALRRSRHFAASVVLSLALGAGVGVPFLGLVRAGMTAPGPYAAAAAREPVRTPEAVLHRTASLSSIAAAEDAGLHVLLATLRGLTLLVLVVAAVNVSILLLARASARRRENAIRVAVGAGPVRLARLLGAEGALLVVAGAVAALAVLAACTWLVSATRPAAVPDGLRVRMDSLAAWMPLAALSVVCAWFCLAPARLALVRSLRPALGAGTHATAGRAEGRLRDALAVLALAASVALAASAGVLARAGAGGAGAETGIDPTSTLTARIDLGGARWADAAGRSAALGRLMAALPATAQVQAESLSSVGTWRGMGAEDEMRVVCGACSRGNLPLAVIDGTARYHAVSPGFFAAVGARLVAGRELSNRARSAAADAPPPAAAAESYRVFSPVAEGPRTELEAVIDETFAHQLFPNGRPLRKKIRIGGSEGSWVTVVGIVAPVRAPGVGNPSLPVPSIYVSTVQFPPRVVGLAVRTRGDPMRAVPAVRRSVARALPGARVGEWRTLESHLAESVLPLRWFGLLFRAMAACSALLAAAGLYGTVSYAVAQRTREIGVRMALGAGAGAVVRWVAARCWRITRAGAVLGLAGAVCMARLLQFSFAGVPLFDPAVFGAILALLGGVAAAASLRPALRAVRVDPMVALRSE